MAAFRRTWYGRPIVPLRPSAFDAFLLLCTLAGVAASIVVFGVFWPQLPERIPTHFGISGQPNAYGGKGVLILLAALSSGLGLGLWVLSRFPQIFNYPRRITEENAPRQYRLAQLLLRIIACAICWFLTYIEWVIAEVGLGRASGFGVWFPFGFIAAMLATIVVYLVLAFRAG